MNLSAIFSTDAYTGTAMLLPWLVGCAVFIDLGALFCIIGRRRVGTGLLAFLSLLFVLIALAQGMLEIASHRVTMVFWLRVLVVSLTFLPVAGSHVFHKLLRPRHMAPQLLLLNWVVSAVLATANAMGPLAAGHPDLARGSGGILNVPLAIAMAIWTAWLVVWTGRAFAAAYTPPRTATAQRHLVYTASLAGLFVLACGLSALYWVGIAIPAYSLIPAFLFLLGTALVLDRYPNSEAALELASHRIVNHLRDGLLALDESGLIHLANPAAEDLLQHPGQELVGSPARRWFGDTVEPAQLQQTTGMPGRGSEHEIPLRRHGDEQPRTISFTVDAVGRSGGASIAYVLVFRDVTEKKRLQNRILQEGLTDPLTGFPNRALFVQMLEQSLETSQGGGESACTVFFLNLDRFKLINDVSGTVAGDHVLLSVADRLRRRLSPGNVLARLGADEFGILCSDVRDDETARERAQAFREVLAPPFRIEGRNLHITASIGVVLNAHNYRHGENLLRDANIAMAEAKRRGGDRHQAFAVEMREFMQQQARIEDALRVAVRKGEFRVFYQPKVDIETWSVVGFEALLRWEHPERGLILPDKFIHIAEETGLMVPIGRWMLESVCRDLSDWNTAMPDKRPAISLNLSDQELYQEDLTEQLHDLLQRHELSSRRLQFEVTERMLMGRGDDILFNRIVDLGIPLHIDDFGTGYSSLSRLQYLPVDALKVDRSFVSRIGHNSSGAAIVRAIVGMSHNLGYHVIVEGVERQQQVEALEEMGCRIMQGFYFSHPVDKATARRMLADQSWLQEACRHTSGQSEPASYSQNSQ